MWYVLGGVSPLIIFDVLNESRWKPFDAEVEAGTEVEADAEVAAEAGIEYKNTNIAWHQPLLST